MKFSINAESRQGNRLEPSRQYVRVLVGDKYFSYAQIAAHIGLTPEQARKRYAAVKAKVWPLTLDDLKVRA